MDGMNKDGFFLNEAWWEFPSVHFGVKERDGGGIFEAEIEGREVIA